MRLNPDIASKLKMVVVASKFLDYRDYLKALYVFLKAELRGYSYLRFAEDLGFSRTNVLHLIIQGRRPLTSKAAAKITAALGLLGMQKSYFATLVQYQNERDPRRREELFGALLEMKSKTLVSTAAKAQLEFFSEWFHPAIFEMTNMDEFRSDPKWIADHLQLRIRPEQVRKSLQLLEALGLIRFDAKAGRHYPTASGVTTGDEIASVAVLRYHQKLIDMGKESLTMVDEAERDISAITICVSREQAAKIKAEIQTFRKRLMAMAEDSEDMEAVYQMNVQLFPLTKIA